MIKACIGIYVHCRSWVLQLTQKCGRPVESTSTTNLPADIAFSCGTGSIVKRTFRSDLRTTFILLPCFSGSVIATTTKALIHFDPPSSSTSWIFQNHCLCFLYEIIDTTHRIEVSGSMLSHNSPTNCHTLYSQIYRK